MNYIAQRDRSSIEFEKKLQTSNKIDVNVNRQFFTDNSYRDEEIDENFNLKISDQGKIKKIDLMIFLKIIFERIEKHNLFEFKKAFMDQHNGFINTVNLLNILISAFKYYFVKRTDIPKSENVLELIEYLIAIKFEDFFLYESEQLTALDLHLFNNSKEELLFTASQFFAYLQSLIEKNESFSYFSKEELSLYSSLFETAENGIKEAKKIFSFFDKEKSKENPQNSIKMFKKSQTMFDNDEKIPEISKKEEDKLAEEVEQIKHRVRFYTISNKKYKMDKNFESDKTKIELIRKNNDFLAMRCKEILNSIIFFYGDEKKITNTTKIKSLLFQHNKNLMQTKKFKMESFTTVLNSSTFNSPENLETSILENSSCFISQDPILPSIKYPKEYFDIFDWDDTEISKQLTLVSHYIFQKIKSKELINSQWTKIDKKTSAANVYKLIERFNKLSLWACEEIISYDKASIRKQVLDKFINISFILYKMNNFNDAFSIVTALNTFFIKELKKTWKKVDPNSSIPKAKELNMIFAHGKNYHKLRELQDACFGKPCIPFLGLYLKDLSYMDESQKYILVDEEGKMFLNCEKIFMVDDILKKLECFQSVKYDIQPVFKLSFLAEPDPQSENNLIELARKLEPNFSLGNKKSPIKRKSNTDTKINELNPFFVKIINKNEYTEEDKKIPLNRIIKDFLQY